MSVVTQISEDVSLAKTAQEALESAGLGWTVELRPNNYPDENGNLRKTPDSQVVVRADTDQPLGTVGKAYTPIQNAEAFAFLDRLVEEGNCEFRSAGCLNCGAEVWLIARVSEGQLPGGEIVHENIRVVTSHDSSKRFRARAEPITSRGVLLGVDLPGTSRQVKVKHTTNYRKRWKRRRQDLLQATQRYYEQLRNQTFRLAEEQIGKGNIEEILEDVYGDSKRGRKQRRRALHYCTSNKGQITRRLSDTKYGVFRKFAQFVEEESTVRKTEKIDGNSKSEEEARFAAAISGSVAKKRNQVFQAFISD